MSYKYSGIDISKWQDPKKVDWEALARQHDFVIIRACYGVKSDWAFEDHFKSARANHVKVRAYTFYRQSQGWKEQLEAFKGELDRVGFGEGDILPVVDLKWNEKYDGRVNPIKFNRECRVLVEELAKMYGGCILYLAPGFYQTLGMPEWMLNYQWLIAHYGVNKPWCPWGSWVIWQYTGSGESMAYPSGVDLNWADKMPPVVDLVPDIEDHEIPNIAEHEAYADIDDPYDLALVSSVSFETLTSPPTRPDQVTVPDGPVNRPAKRSLIQSIIDWLKLWIFSRNGK